jgi:hypothetical protein
MTEVKPRPSIEALREQWHRQLIADADLTVSILKVALAIGFHLNRNRGGWAWPGIQTIAKIAHVDRRTVMRATAWLSDRGHLQVVRTRLGQRNLANHYRPILKQTAASAPGPVAMSLGSGKAMSVGGGRAMSPKPLTEPLTEPHIPINISAPTGVGADESETRQKKGSERIERRIAPSPACECYRLAGAYDGDRGRKLVTKALDGGADPQEVLEEIGAAVETGNDLGEALSSFWNHEWG